MWTVGALVYPNFELLDLFGPLELLGWQSKDFDIVLVGPERGAIASNMGPAVLADVAMTEQSRFDILLVPGGWGRSIPVETEALVPWLGTAAAEAGQVLTVCTGSALLALTGFLDGRPATTNKALFSWVAEKRPQVDWRPRARWVQDGGLFTSSGVSAGMDMTLAAIAAMIGADVAEEIACGCEYSWHRNPDDDPFAAHIPA
jgi:transcriptional regulator GlxA family with amidase domain